MLKFRALIGAGLMILPAVFGISGQSGPMMIFWDEKKSCGVSNVTIDRSTIKCERKKTDGFEFYSFEHKDLTIRADFVIRETAIKAVLVVKNDGSKDLSVDVGSWVASSFKTYEGFSAGEKPLLMGKAADPFKTYSKMVRGPSTSGLPGSGTMTNTGSARTANVPGTTMSQPQPRGRDGIVMRGREVSGENDSAKDWKLIPAKSELKGAVAFANTADATFRLIALDINGVVYIFAVSEPH